MNPYLSALHYAQHYGFAVFPTHGIKTVFLNGKEIHTCTCGMIECGSPGKHPATNKGRNAASKDSNVIENLWAGRDFLNVAIATGIESKIFVVDVDGEKGEKSLNELIREYEALPKTLVSITGRGKHYVFRYPDRKVFNRTNCLGAGIDVRGDGGYICAAPSKHISGITYAWEDANAEVSAAPQWLLDKVCSQSKAPVVHEKTLDLGPSHEWSESDVHSMLDYLDPDMGYSDWINVGMALQAGGYSFEIWDIWSKRGAKYDNRTAFHWRSFKNTGGITMGTLVDMSKARGWKPTEYITEKLDWETHPAKEWLIAIGAYCPAGKPKANIIALPAFEELPLNCMELPGVIGETIRWIVDTAIKPQPELAMMNVITALGAVFGRRYASPINTRTNLYMCGIAGTGKGKDHSRKQIKNLMVASGLEGYLASDDIKSATGILSTLSKKPTCVMMLDEFGLLLQGIVNDKAGGYKKDIGAMLLKLYTTSGSYYTAGDYADKKQETTVVKDPNICIYGTTTLDNYIAALKKIAIRSGDLNRFIVLPGRDKPELREEDVERGIPETILQGWRELIPSGNGLSALNSSLIEPSITEVSWGQCKEYVKGLLKTEADKIENGEIFGTGELWSRYREHVIKIAMIFAICRSATFPVIEMEDLKIAEKIVNTGTRYVIDLATNHMYENEHERQKKEMLSHVRKAGADGVMRKELLKAMGGIRGKDFDELIKSLVEEERIEGELVKPEKGRSTVVYRYLGR